MDSHTSTPIAGSRIAYDHLFPETSDSVPETQELFGLLMGSVIFIILVLLWAWCSNFMLGFFFGPNFACYYRGGPSSAYCLESMQSKYDYIHQNHLTFPIVAAYIIATYFLARWIFSKGTTGISGK